MLAKLTVALLPTFALALSACGSNTATDPHGSGGGGGAGGSGGSGGGGAIACKGTTVVADAANNYSFSSTLSFPPVKVQPKANLTFDWSGVTSDFIGHTVDPKHDLNTILIFEWNLTLADLESKLNKDALQSSDMTVTPPLSLTTNGSDMSAKLLDFTLNGSQIGADGGLVTVDQVMLFFDPEKYDPATHILTLMAATGNKLGYGTRMIQAFQLDSSSTNTTVTVNKDSTKLDYAANLHDLRPTGIPAGTAKITLDWGKMTTNALGNEFVTTFVTEAIVAHYTETPTELEKKFLDLQLIATDYYEGVAGATGGTTVDLSTLTTASGKSFPGIDNNGTWIAALQCGGCRNPAPWYLTVLKPCN